MALVCLTSYYLKTVKCQRSMSWPSRELLGTSRHITNDFTISKYDVLFMQEVLPEKLTMMQ